MGVHEVGQSGGWTGLRAYVHVCVRACVRACVRS